MIYVAQLEGAWHAEIPVRVIAAIGVASRRPDGAGVLLAEHVLQAGSNEMMPRCIDEPARRQIRHDIVAVLLEPIPHGLIDLAHVVERQRGSDAPVERMEIDACLGGLFRDPRDLLVPCLSRVSAGVAGARRDGVPDYRVQRQLTASDADLTGDLTGDLAGHVLRERLVGQRIETVEGDQILDVAHEAPRPWASGRPCRPRPGTKAP